MSNPINPINPGIVGRVDAELRVETDKVPDDIRKGLSAAEAQADRDIDAWGSRAGDTFSKSFGARAGAGTRQYFNDLSSDFGDVLANIRDNFDLDFTPEDEDRARRRGRSWFGSFVDGIKDAFTGNQKTFQGLFQSLIQGPVGQFFNVGAKSPLAIILIPLLGTIIALVTAVIYGLQAAIALLYLIPSLLFAIGLQAAALFFIFGGLGEVFSAAFAAKTPEELEEALKGVRVEVAEVIRALLPLKDFFSLVRDSAQLAFFGNLDATKITAVIDRIQGPFGQAIVNIAGAFGNVANNLLDVFASPAFGTLINVLGDSTVQWLQGFGPALARFIDGLNLLGIAIDPFLDWFGVEFNQTLSSWGDFLAGLGSDPAFLKWVEDAKVILGDFMDLFGTFVNGVVVFIQQFIAADDQIRERHGEGFLDLINELIGAFIAFLASPIGQDALEGFILALGVLTGAFVVLAATFLLVLAGANKVGEALELLVDWIGQTAVPAIGDFFSAVGEFFSTIWAFIKQGWFLFTRWVGEQFSQLGTNIETSIQDIRIAIINWLNGLPEEAFRAGINFINRLADGMKSAMPGLTFVVNGVTSWLSGFFNHSPAEHGPLAGKGDPLFAGQEFVKRLATGIKMEAPTLGRAVAGATTNMTFDPGAVQVNYYGDTPPTQNQMNAMGKAAGQGIVGQMNSTRIAVRTL